MRINSIGRSRLWGTLAVVVLTLAACGGNGGSGSSYKEDGKALIFPTFNPFTGADANFGPEMRAGCPAAAKSIMDAGGILGHTSIECPAVDSRGDPADAVPAAQKMLATTSNLMEVIGPSSDEASATVPIFDAAKKPMFVDTGQPSFDKSDFKYFWRVTPSDDYYGYAMARYAWDAGYRNAALVFGNDISSQGTVPTITSGFQKLGGKIAINLTLTIGQASYRSEVQKLVAANPDVIFNEVDPQTAATFFGQLKQLHGSLYPFVSTGAQYTPWLQAVTATVGAAQLSENYHTVLGTSEFSGPAYEEYKTNLLTTGAQIEKPDQWVQDIYAEGAYDGVIIAALAMLAAGTTDPSVWNSDIIKVTTKSASATVVNTFAQGKAALAAGTTIDYEGATGAFAFTQWHNSSGGFEVLGFAAAGMGSAPIIKVYPAGAINSLVG
jgi:branched-chain amino acid transport system substrate-binding protein